MSDMLQFELEDDVAVISLDDGKANACGFAMLNAIMSALERAEQEANAVVLLGRPGVLSGGFDLKVINAGDEAEIKRMLELGVRALMQLYACSKPLVVGATGHAVALGAFILLTGDYRIGSAGDFKIGLNESAIGLNLPTFGFELASARLSKRYLTRAAVMAELYSPAESIDAGFLDEVVSVDGIRKRSIETASRLAALDGPAFANNKLGFRQALINRVVNELESA